MQEDISERTMLHHPTKPGVLIWSDTEAEMSLEEIRTFLKDEREGKRTPQNRTTKRLGSKESITEDLTAEQAAKFAADSNGEKCIEALKYL
ncbi:MAG TPA: hypothetical protein VNY29_12145 [Terriglobales bacterium]|jgi:hypothetical protein|nr:hypothetical protein [Terriglobales bacterium]